MFKNIKGLKAKRYTDDIGNMLEFSGSKEVLEKLKNKLTFTNKSIGYRINILKKDIKAWSGRGEYGNERAAKAALELQEITPQLTVEYFVENGDKVVAPAGFWFLAEEVTDGYNLNTEIEPYYLDMLRDYQREAIKSALKYKRAMVVMATGLGKSLTLSSLALSFVQKGKRVLIIVPTQDLVDQFVKSVQKVHNSVTGAHSALKPKQGCDIMIVSAGTAKKYIDMFDCVLVDEAHHNPMATISDLLGETDHLEYTYAFTATPFRSDGLNMAISAFGGPTVFERDLIWAIENKWLHSFDVYRSELRGFEKGEDIIVPSKRMKTSAYKKIVNNDHFLHKLAKILKKGAAENRKIMVLFKTLAPAKKLAKICKKDLTFSVADANWKKPLRDFQEGKSSVLVATSKLVGEGIDIPDADMLILVTQSSSDGIVLQALGRILRLSEGKKKPLVFDIIAGGYSPFINAARNRKKIWNKAADKVIDISL